MSAKTRPARFALWLMTALSATAQNFPLTSPQALQPRNVAVTPTTYQGRKALQVVPLANSGGGIVVLPKANFHNGTIDLEVAGKPGPNAPGEARGFVGVAFRVTADASKYECFYIRPTNGRADDQLRRNHSTQYISFPDFEFQRLRDESAGQYESYADLETGAWTRIKVQVNGTKARLFVNGATQPALIVNNLKLGDTKGLIALWIGVGTEAYFANLHLSE